jgi:hypothetical protein
LDGDGWSKRRAENRSELLFFISAFQFFGVLVFVFAVRAEKNKQWPMAFGGKFCRSAKSGGLSQN